MRDLPSKDTGTGSLVSGSTSASFKKPKTRSAAAIVDWSMFIDCAIWLIGWVKLRVYVINDWMSPIAMT